jgi:nitrogenase-associated protein
MDELVFYEKPDCVGNGMQKSLLSRQGVRYTVRDLLTHPWTEETLRPYFGGKPVAEWFNSSAPRVKSGEIPISRLSEREALAMMLEEPILICRPLLELGGIRQSGFLPGPVLDALGIRLEPEANLQDCPMGTAQPVCEDPG